MHIVINSLRIEEVPLLPYMDRPADTRAGCKHRCTDAAMEYFKAEVMEMCHRENLYQIDLLHGSKNRITEREYWAQKKGQAKLDKENAALAAEGQPVKQTKFETDKAKLRQTIRNLSLIHISVYLKGKNAKKYRHGMEYGSARWGTPKDIEPFMAPKFEDNIKMCIRDRVWPDRTQTEGAGQARPHLCKEFFVRIVKNALLES